MTLHERLAPLREETPTDAEVTAVFAAAKPRPRRRLALGLVTATAVAAVAIAALPAADPDDPVALLNAAAATAADEPPAFAGYRYTEIDERFGERRQHVENWVDRGWQGRAITDGREREFMYGDGPLLDLDIASLPTEPKALMAALEANERGMNWAPGLPTADQVRYDVTRSILLLLGTANTTPDLRAGLWGALALLPGLEASDAKDPRGREGDAVTLPAPSNLPTPAGVGSRRTGTFTVIFDPDSSELLSWSEIGSGGGIPDQVHTFVRAGHVRNLGDRPR